jgi:hypothetical protein
MKTVTRPAFQLRWEKCILVPFRRDFLYRSASKKAQIRSTNWAHSQPPPSPAFPRYKSYKEYDNLNHFLWGFQRDKDWVPLTIQLRMDGENVNTLSLFPLSPSLKYSSRSIAMTHLPARPGFIRTCIRQQEYEGKKEKRINSYSCYIYK